MTTIVSDGKVVVYDSRACIDSVISSDNYEKSKVIDGVYYIGAGASHEVNRLIDIYLSGEPYTGEVLNACVWMSKGDGTLYQISSDANGPVTYDILQSEINTMGSGQEFAMAAMDLGLTPKQAVKYTMTRDTGTGGKIRQFKLKR